MATSIEKAGLPPMVSHDDVVRQGQQTDLKEFRKYLIQSGAVKSLVKLYQHTLKNEIRMDNANLVSEFMNKYRDGGDPRVEEVEQLVAENSELREANVALAQKFAQMEAEIEAEKKKRGCREVWKALSPGSEGLTGAQLFARLCGTFYDAGAGCVLVELVRPEGLSPERMTQAIDPESFVTWMAAEASEDVVDWCERVLLPKLKESADPPFEKNLVQDIQDSGLLPANAKDVAASVVLESGLRDFLDSIVQRFADSPAE